ncbi:ATP-binding cassette domain-containing protein [Formicincola oecophyllae]|nr:ABC transporter ATP-binding protein [Formicincola oecophyllae]
MQHGHSPGAQPLPVTLRLTGGLFPVSPALLPGGIQMLDLSLYPGQFNWIEGISGAGKTVLLETLALMRQVAPGCTLLLPEGPAAYQGVMGAEKILAPLRRHTGYVAECPPTHQASGHSTVQVMREAIRRSCRPEDRQGLAQQAEGARMGLEFAGLLASAEKPAALLSWGERMRLAAACALAGRPSLFLVDAALWDVAPWFTERMLDQLQRHGAKGATIVLAARPEQAAQLVQEGDRVVNLPHMEGHTMEEAWQPREGGRSDIPPELRPTTVPPPPQPPAGGPRSEPRLYGH